MDNKQIAAYIITALVALGIGVTAENYADFVPSNDYICIKEEMTYLNCPGGISGGKQTRCYDTDKSSWTTCSTGWKDISPYLKEQLDLPNTGTYEIYANGVVWTCTKDKEIQSGLDVCTSVRGELKHKELT